MVDVTRKRKEAEEKLLTDFERGGAPAGRPDAGEEAEQRLLVSFELGLVKWKLAFAKDLASPKRIREVDARSLEAVKREIELARKALGLSETAKVVSCYEAGRDGFWIHRWLLSEGIENVVVDSASIEVNRRKRRAKTDRIDAHKLVTMLVRYLAGETDVWSVARVPSEENEDARHLHRGLAAMKKERTRYTNRIKGVLMQQGIYVQKIGNDELVAWVRKVKKWDGKPLGEELCERVRQEHARLMAVREQIRAVESKQRKIVREASKQREASEEQKEQAQEDGGAAHRSAAQKVAQLTELRGIGMKSAWVLVHEAFAWRKFANRREVGGYLGFTPTPYDSGESTREQGISKAGNSAVKALMTELGWAWLHYQPHSALSRWYQKRWARGGERMRKIGIVALARKLLIALWRYVEFGEIPEGASLKLVEEAS